MSGVMLRSTGVKWDLRRSQPYECYNELDFKIPVGKNGDNYDRYIMRMEEMREATKIMKQCIEKMPAGSGGHHRQQDHAAAPRRNEDLDGSPDPSLQALHRRLSCSGRRGLWRGGSAQGRIRRLSGGRRHQQALSLQDPRAQSLCICRRWITCARAICWPTFRRCWVRSTSCSGRWTGESANPISTSPRNSSTPITPRTWTHMFPISRKTASSRA